MAWLISAVDENLRPSHRAVHRVRECVQFRRLIRVVEVPDEFVRYFSPCSFCVPPSQAWRPPEDRAPRALIDWYRDARERSLRGVAPGDLFLGPPRPMGDRGDFDVWRGEIAGAKAGKPQDWGDEGPGPDELEVLLDVIEEAGRREEVERRLRDARGW